MTQSIAHPSVTDASRHLWEALSHHSVTLDLGAHDPLVVAVATYGQACREHDQAKIDLASKHVWEEMTHHSVTLDLGAHDPFVRALAEFGQACREAGPRQ